MNAFYIVAVLLIISGIFVIFTYRARTIIQTLFLFTAISTLLTMIQGEEDSE